MEGRVGVPQGSILGPTLSNVLYGELLRVELGERTRLVAYADDVTLLARAKKERDLVDEVNRALVTVDSWMKENGLSLAPEKTEASP